MSITLGIPSGLMPSPEMAMSEGVTGSFVRVQPNNLSSVTSGTLTVTALSTADVAGSYAFPVQPLNFSIPCGMANTWYDPARATLSYRATYRWTGAGAGYTATSANLRGGAMSFFDRITHVSGNGQVLDDVVGLSQCSLLEDLMSQNVSDRDSLALSGGYLFEGGADSNLFQGHAIKSLGTNPVVAGTNSSSSYSYAVPLPSSLLGKYAKGWFPAGKISKLDIQLTTNSVLPITLIMGGVATTSPTFEVILDNFAINLYAVRLDDKTSSIVNSVGEHYIHGITHRVSTSSIQPTTVGQISVLLGVRGKSCRSLTTRCSENKIGTNGCVNGPWDSKYIPATSLNYFLTGNKRVPEYPINSLINSAGVFEHALQAWEEFSIKGQKFASTANGFCNFYQSATAIVDELAVDYPVREATSISSSQDLATFHFSENLQKASSSKVLDGYDLSTSANNFFEATLAYPNTNALILTTIGKFDVVFVFSNGNLEVRQ